jgi:hypothetical protein
MVEVGKQYRFKTTKGRGRPSVGTVVRKAGVFVVVLNRGQEVRLPVKALYTEHKFVPYNTKKRQAAQAA